MIFKRQGIFARVRASCSSYCCQQLINDIKYNIHVWTLHIGSTNAKCAETVQPTSIAYGKQRPHPQSWGWLDLVRGFQERGWMKWATKPSIFLSSCWALCVLGVPSLWVTSNKPLRHAREWKWEFGVHGLSCLNLSPWGQTAQILSSLSPCPDFPQECVFPNLMGKCIIYFITEFTVKPTVFLMCGTNVNKTKKHGLWFI